MRGTARRTNGALDPRRWQVRQADCADLPLFEAGSPADFRSEGSWQRPQRPRVENQRRDERAAKPEDHVAVITKLVHELGDRDRFADHFELSEAVKSRIGDLNRSHSERSKIRYDSDTIRRAIDSAEFQRARVGKPPILEQRRPGGVRRAAAKNAWSGQAAPAVVGDERTRRTSALRRKGENDGEECGGSDLS